MQSKELYEEIKIRDLEFPVRIGIHNVCSQGYYTKPHWHEHVEFLYVLEGEAVFGINQTQILACAGDLIVANSNDLHSIYCTEGHLKHLVIIFEMDKISKTLVGKNVLFQTYIPKDSVITQYMEQMRKELEQEKEESKLMCKGLVYILIAYLTRQYAVAFLEDKNVAKRAKNMERINEILDYVDKYYANPLSNTELAQVIHVSENHFYSLFKEMVGVSPHQYINEIRLKKAMNLLTSGDYTLTEVAEMTGFTDYNNFGRKFKEYYGYPPSKAIHRNL